MRVIARRGLNHDDVVASRVASSRLSRCEAEAGGNDCDDRNIGIGPARRRRQRTWVRAKADGEGEGGRRRRRDARAKADDGEGGRRRGRRGHDGRDIAIIASSSSSPPVDAGEGEVTGERGDAMQGERVEY